jgi:hypothetical protein
VAEFFIFLDPLGLLEERRGLKGCVFEALGGRGGEV